MKILVVSSYLPYPLHSGGHVRLYNLIRELSDKHEITLICEKRPHQTGVDVKEVEKICKKVVTVNRRKQWSIKNIAKASLSPHSFLVTGHTLPEMQEKIREELESESYDLVHVETFYVMQNLPRVILERSGSRAIESREILSRSLPATPVKQAASLRPAQDDKQIPIVLVEHNIEYNVYQKFVNRAPAPLRTLLKLDIAKIKREEEAAWKQATALVAVSEEDKKVMSAAGFASTIVANGVDVDHFRLKPSTSGHTSRHIPSLRQEGRERKLLFIGDFKWIQNQDSAKFIIQDIWPKIKRVILERSGNGAIESKEILSRSLPLQDDVKLWIVAREIPGAIRNLTDDPDILFDVESSSKSTPEIFQEADVLLAPIRVGGGTSYKILESMACGTPVVTMQMSASAIHAQDGEHLMVGQTAEELAEKTIQLLQNDATYERISRKGRELIEERYSWKMIAEELEKVYTSVIPGRKPGIHSLV